MRAWGYDCLEVIGDFNSLIVMVLVSWARDKHAPRVESGRKSLVIVFPRWFILYEMGECSVVQVKVKRMEV